MIDTETNTVKGKMYVGRSSHEALFRPNGCGLWVAARSENYVSVIDPAQKKEVRRIETANSQAWFFSVSTQSSLFVPSSFTPEMDVIDTTTYKVITRVPQARRGGIEGASGNLAVADLLVMGVV